jgi:hypothetical protein
MSRIVWLASYPKSGNTWFRMILANLGAREPADINNLPVRGGIASGRREFDDVTLLDSGLLTHDETEALRPRAYEAFAQGDWLDPEADPGPWPRFMKAHDAYVATPLGEPLLAAAGRAILIVRDPRDIAPSVANHFHRRIDGAIRMMGDPTTALSKSVRSQPNQMRQRLLDWSGHCASWLGQRDVAVHLVRYEDLAADPVAVFSAAMAFAGREAAEADIVRAIDFARFERLQAQERARGFKEWRPRQGRAFFRRGQAGGWRGELSAEQVRRIEAAHGAMMRRLGYALSADQGMGQGEAAAEEFG